LHPLGNHRVLFLLRWWLLPFELNALKHFLAVAVPPIEHPQRADALEQKLLD
jgi:hypothetical protein